MKLSTKTLLVQTMTLLLLAGSVNAFAMDQSSDQFERFSRPTPKPLLRAKEPNRTAETDARRAQTQAESQRRRAEAREKAATAANNN